MNQSFLNARSQWYEAYLAGDVRRLEEIESPGFIVVTAGIVQDRATQLAGISAAGREGRWFPESSVTQDHRLDVQTLADDVLAVYGVGQIVTPRGNRPLVAFTEIWTRTAPGWQVVHLHYHEVPDVDGTGLSGK